MDSAGTNRTWVFALIIAVLLSPLLYIWMNNPSGAAGRSHQELVQLLSSFSRDESYVYGSRGRIYAVTVLQASNMSATVDPDGFLTVYLTNSRDEAVYEDFNWSISGLNLEGFPKSFSGQLKPREVVEVYKVFLPSIFREPGAFEVIIASSKRRTVEVPMNRSAGLRIQAPFLSVECRGPGVCVASFPEYFIVLKLEAGADDWGTRSPKIVLKTLPLDVSLVNEPGLTRIEIFAVNNANSTLKIVDDGWRVNIYDASWRPVGGCSLPAPETRSIAVDPGGRELLRVFNVWYRNGTLYIGGAVCVDKLDPGRYIAEFVLNSDPQIYAATSIDVGVRPRSVWSSGDAAVDILVEYTVEAGREAVKKYAEKSLATLIGRASTFEGFENPAVLKVRVKVVNTGNSTIRLTGTGCNFDVFAYPSIARVEEGRYEGLALAGICLPLWYAPLKPGDSLTDETYSKYTVLVVDRPFRAALKMTIEVLHSCSGWHWEQCSGRAFIFTEASVRIVHPSHN